ncbi:MAG: winged helix-turn-helix domain-containing protein [Gemmatimonadota bacterium]
MSTRPDPLGFIGDPDTAVTLLKEPRRRILDLARSPISTVEMAERLGETRQRIGYHVRQLVQVGLLEETEGTRRGAMVEKQYSATADAFTLSPELLGPLAARLESSADRESVTHLLGAVHQVQTDLAGVLEHTSAGTRVPTLTLSTELRFQSAAQRGAFAEALVNALTQVVGAHSGPFQNSDGAAASGDPFRLTLTLHPTVP